MKQNLQKRLQYNIDSCFDSIVLNSSFLWLISPKSVEDFMNQSFRHLWNNIINWEVTFPSMQYIDT